MLETAGALLVPVAVIVLFESPTICVNESVLVVRVICEFEVAVVPFSELRVRVRSPVTKMRLPVLVTVLWPERVTYVNSEPEKSLMAMVVLIVERSEFVNSKAVDSGLSVVEGDSEVPDEERVAEAVVDISVPVPVSSCALTPSAARHSSHTGRDNMVASMSLLFRALQKGDSRQYEGKQSIEQAEQVEHRRMDEIYRFNPPSQTGRWVMMGLLMGLPTETCACPQTVRRSHAFSQGPC